MDLLAALIPNQPNSIKRKKRDGRFAVPQPADKVPRKALVFHGSLLYFVYMLKKSEAQQQEFELVSIEALLPEKHLLRKVDKAVDFSFIRDRVKHLYSEDNGRPALDPVVLFKLLLVGYLYGVRSERQLMREVEVNVAYRWFLGLKLRGKVPDASTLSQNRRRRFSESTIYQEIFDEIVLLAVNKGLASGTVLYTDSTHLKANANKNKYDLEQVQVKPQAYLAALDAAVAEDRAAHRKRPLKEQPETEPETKEIKVSRTDKDSGYMVRDGKPKGFFYLDHRTVDGRHAIITDTHVTRPMCMIRFHTWADYSDKAITATVDTLHVATDYSLNAVEFSITNRSSTREYAEMENEQRIYMVALVPASGISRGEGLPIIFIGGRRIPRRALIVN